MLSLPAGTDTHTGAAPVFRPSPHTVCRCDKSHPARYAVLLSRPYKTEVPVILLFWYPQQNYTGFLFRSLPDGMDHPD